MSQLLFSHLSAIDRSKDVRVSSEVWHEVVSLNFLRWIHFWMIVLSASGRGADRIALDSHELMLRNVIDLHGTYLGKQESRGDLLQH